MKQWTREFDTSQKETCMNRWIIQLKQAEGDAVPVIESLEIERASQGCPGHPKTISALVRNRSIDQIDLEGLEQTTCPRPHFLQAGPGAMRFCTFKNGLSGSMTMKKVLLINGHQRYDGACRPCRRFPVTTY